MSAPVETKVTAATVTAAATTLVLYLLSLVLPVDEMPAAAYGAVVVLVTAAATFAAGWLAPHTTRGGDHRA